MLWLASALQSAHSLSRAPLVPSEDHRIGFSLACTPRPGASCCSYDPPLSHPTVAVLSPAKEVDQLYSVEVSIRVMAEPIPQRTVRLPRAGGIKLLEKSIRLRITALVVGMLAAVGLLVAVFYYAQPAEATRAVEYACRTGYLPGRANISRGKSRVGADGNTRWQAVGNDLGGLINFFDLIVLHDRLPAFNYTATFERGLNFQDQRLGSRKDVVSVSKVENTSS